MKNLQEAIIEAKKGMNQNAGGPFGAIITDENGNVVATGHNTVLKSKDPTAHAEINAIREACKKLNTIDLSEYTLISTCEPCPMCLSAIIWSNIKRVYFGANRHDAKKVGFKDNAIYEYLKGENQLLKIVDTKDKACIELLQEYDGKMY